MAKAKKKNPWTKNLPDMGPVGWLATLGIGYIAIQAQVVDGLVGTFVRVRAMATGAIGIDDGLNVGKPGWLQWHVGRARPVGAG